MSSSENTVLISVYVERPKKKASRVHNRLHPHSRCRVITGKNGATDRRAELLQYSRLLREHTDDKLISSAEKTQSKPPKVSSKKGNWGNPGCFGYWKKTRISCLRTFMKKRKSYYVPNFGFKIKASVKRLRVLKISKFIARFRTAFRRMTTRS